MRLGKPAATKYLVMLASAVLILASMSWAADDNDKDQTDIGKRIEKSAEVLNEIMGTPDKAIPDKVMDSSKCIAVIPSVIKIAVGFGGQHGKGIVTCRTAHGWSAPMFLAIEGGSVGYQIGGSSTDLIMLFMNDHALHSLLSDKFKLGADASVAAGPVGRSAAAGTDLKLNAEILSYSRSKGIFAGVSLDGAVVQADKSGDQAQYGANVTSQEILDGQVEVPSSARRLIHELRAYPGATMGM